MTSTYPPNRPSKLRARLFRVWSRLMLLRKTSSQEPDKQATPPPSKQHWRRRDFLAISAKASLLWSLGLQACGPTEPVETEEEKQRKEEEKQRLAREKICRAETSQDNAKASTLQPEATKQDDAIFSFGVQSGVMTSSGALLWTFVEDDTPKQLRVWRKAEGDDSIQLVIDREATPKEGFIHETVEGLKPGQRYHFAFFVRDNNNDTARSRIGSFYTAFADNCLQPITLAATACTYVKRYPVFKSLQWMAKQDIHLSCHLGDMSYNDGAETKKAFHNKWKKTLQAPGYPEFLAHTGLYATWDDHESTDNSKLYDKPASFRELARDSYFQHTVQPQNLPNKRFWSSYRWGTTAEFFVLDCRGERQPDKNIYISQEQMDWLKKSLKESPCHFKILLNSVPIIKFTPIWIVAEDDRWEGYHNQREELLDHITTQNISNVWFLGGDYHIGVVAKVEREGPRSNLWEILVGPGGNHPPEVLANVLGSMEGNEEAIAPPDQFKYIAGKAAATLITFDPIEDTVHVKFVDPETEKVDFETTLSQDPKKLA